MFTMCLLYNVRIQCPRFRMCVYTLCLALHGVYVYNVFPYTMCLVYNVRIQCPRFRMCVYTLCLALHGVYVYNVFPCTMCLRIQCAYSQRLLGLECVCIHNVFRSTPIPISIWVLSYACHNSLLHLQSRSTSKPSCMLLLFALAPCFRP